MYKNGDGRNLDIFKEGVAPMIKSSIIAQTFGIPTADPKICTPPYTVGNSNEIDLTDKVSWTQGSDHSKWIYALNNGFSCFGDLNRNTVAQLVRGGSFYCINNTNLNKALKILTPKADKCP